VTATVAIQSEVCRISAAGQSYDGHFSAIISCMCGRYRLSRRKQIKSRDASMLLVGRTTAVDWCLKIRTSVSVLPRNRVNPNHQRVHHRSPAKNNVAIS